MKTIYKNPETGNVYILRAIIVGMGKGLTDDDVAMVRYATWRHSKYAYTLITRTDQDALGTEACFCFQIHFVKTATLIERIRYGLSVLATTALGYIGISTVKITVVPDASLPLTVPTGE